MTVTSTYTPQQYTGNGVTTSFPFPFLFYFNSEIGCQVFDSSTGLTTTWVLGTDFTLTGAGNSGGGTITQILSVLTATQTLTIFRKAAYTQPTHYTAYGPLPPASIEQNLDELTFQTQQLASTQSRAIQFPITDPSALSGTLPAAAVRAGFYLAFDVNGAPTLASAAGTLVPLTGTSVTSNAVGTGTKTFTTQANLGFLPGGFVVIASSASPSNYVAGQITAYSPASGVLTINSTAVGGTGTFASWNIQVSGPVTGGALLAANNLSDLGSATTALSNLGAGLAAQTFIGTIDPANDAFWLESASAGASRKTAMANMFASGNSLTTKSTPIGADKIVILDSTNSFAARVSTISSLVTSPFSKSFNSSASPQTISSAGLLTIAHGMGVIPSIFQCYLTCGTGNVGYSAGNVVGVSPNTMDGSVNRGFTLWLDSTNINIRFGSGGASNIIYLLNQGTGAAAPITETLWTFSVLAYA